MKLFGIAAIVAVSQAGLTDVVEDKLYSNGEIVDPKSPKSSAGAASEDIDEREDRRYVDLSLMSSKHWKKQGNGRDWDERKFWGYGCHCFMVGDRPMSDMGHGKPVDALDSACRLWKDCQKCVRENHGDDCIGEMRKYTWKYSSKQQTFVMMNKPGTCEREIGECDLKFVFDTYANKDSYNEDFNYFFGGFDKNDDQDSCPSTPGTPVAHQCCGGYTSAWYWISSNNQQCCVDASNNKIQHPADVNATC